MKFRQTAKILASIFILIFSYNSVLPHSCATYKNLNDKEYAQKLDTVNSIFSGEIISSQQVEPYVYIIEMQVLSVWKGVESQSIKIKFTDPCSYEANRAFQKGEKWMVYGYSTKNSELIDVNCCNFSSFDDERMKKIYGEGKIIEQPQPSPTPMETSQGFWTSLWKTITSFFS